MKKLITYLVLLISCSASADPNSYLTAEFYNPIYYSRDGLVAEWKPLDAGTTGDLGQGAGSMEVWGADVSCLTCPVGAYCDCTTFGGDLYQDTTYIYDGNSSTRLGTLGVGIIGVLVPVTAGHYYQLSFWYRGVAGGENVFGSIIGMTSVNYYDATTDTWGPGFSAVTYGADAANWQRAVIYVVADNTETAYFNAANFGETVYIDKLQVHELLYAAPHSSVGNFTLANPVTSDPVFGDSKSLMYKAADGPARSNGTWLDGTDDGFTSTVDHPTESFSAGCRFNADTKVPGALMGNSDAAGIQRGWEFLVYNDGNIYYDFCNTPGWGVGCEEITSVGTFEVDRNISTMVTFNAATLGLTLNVNNVATVSGLADGPMNAGAPHLSVGVDGDFTNYFFDGDIEECRLYNKALDAIDVSKWINPYFPGNNYNRGSYVATCIQAAAPAICSAQYCRDGTPNACQAQTTGSQDVFTQATELVPYNSFEANTGTDETPIFTGWTPVLVPGDGTAAITAYRDDAKHGSASARVKLTGTTSHVYLNSSCMAVNPSTTYFPYAAVKSLWKNVPVRWALYTYSDGACADWEWTTSSTNVITNSSWQDVANLAVTTQVSTLSVILVLAVNGEADILWDAASFRMGSYHTPWFNNPGAGTTTSNSKDYRIHNTLADQKSDGTYPYTTGFCASAWVYTDWNGTDTAVRGILTIPAIPALNRNRIELLHTAAGGTLYLCVYDDANNYKCKYESTNANNWSGSNWKYIEACSSNTGTVIGHWYNLNNLTWYTLSNSQGVGTGIQSSCSDTIYVGAYDPGANFLGGYIPYFNISPYNAAYTYKGFNSGHPPNNSNRPY